METAQPQGNQATERLTAEVLERRLRLALLRHTFMYGQGAPLVFLWIAGAGLFLIVWSDPLFASLWTIFVLICARLLVRDRRVTPEFRRQFLMTYAQRRMATASLLDAQLQGAVGQGLNQFVEIAAKVLELRQTRGDVPAIADVIADADALIRLQLESAKQAEELRRLLSLASCSPAAPSQTHGSLTQQVHQQTIDAISREAADAEGLVTQISQQLETLMLQVFRLERRASDLVEAIHTTQQAGDMLSRLHAIVDARRKAADEVTRSLQS